MARWRLLNPHYLRVPGTEWEYVEISRSSNKQARVRYPVGLFLNPNDPADHNYPGEIIVAHAKPQTEKVGTVKFHVSGGTKSHDIIFEGPPTPDMEPLDEEAEKISQEWQAKWVHPIDSLSNEFGYGDHSQSLLSRFESELTDAIKRVGGIPQGQQNVSVKPEDFEKLRIQVAELTKQNAILLQKVNEKPEIKVQPK